MKSKETYYPVAMTVAGSDSGGGAGIQADLRTFAAFGVFGTSAITAITSQNPTRVARVDILPEAAVTAQIRAVRERFAVGAVKTGMLANAAIIKTVAREFAGLGCPVIVDPVMIATSGAGLLEEDAIATLTGELLPLADWITPNVPEAEALTGMKIESREAMAEAARQCASRWNCGCIIKGGHFKGGNGSVDDMVAYQDQVFMLSSPEIMGSAATHGTGCTFSAAIAAGMALKGDWEDVLAAAKAFVYGSLVEEVVVGAGTHAMYPPLETYDGEITFRRVDNSRKR